MTDPARADYEKEAIIDLCKVLVLQELSDTSNTEPSILPQLTHEILAAAFASLMKLRGDNYHHDMAKARRSVIARKQQLETEMQQNRSLDEVKCAVKHLDTALSSISHLKGGGQGATKSPTSCQGNINSPKHGNSSVDKKRKAETTMEEELVKLERLSKRLKGAVSPYSPKYAKLA